MKSKYKQLFFLLICQTFFVLQTVAQERTDRFEIEAGVVATQNMEIRGFNQGNATENWSKTAPTFRLEYWKVKKDDWNYGIVFQPLTLKYQDKLRSDLNYKGKIFNSGDTSTLNYQFPTVRFSANTPIFQSEEQTYFRLGGSAVVRYAKVGLTGGGQSFNDTNLLVIPLINMEGSKNLGEGYSLVTRSDFLPGIDGNIFLDGLYDVFFGLRKKMDGGGDFDIGLRLFFGGYDPKKKDDYANRIFFNSLVARYSF